MCEASELNVDGSERNIMIHRLIHTTNFGYQLRTDCGDLVWVYR